MSAFAKPLHGEEQNGDIRYFMRNSDWFVQIMLCYVERFPSISRETPMDELVDHICSLITNYQGGNPYEPGTNGADSGYPSQGA